MAMEEMVVETVMVRATKTAIVMVTVMEVEVEVGAGRVGSCRRHSEGSSEGSAEGSGSGGSLVELALRLASME